VILISISVCSLSPTALECSPIEYGGVRGGRFDRARCSFQKIPSKRSRLKKSSLFVFLGQMHLWNPDEPSTPRGAARPLSARLEERLRDACDELQIPGDGCAGHSELLALCDRLGLEVRSQREWRRLLFCIFK